MYENDAMENMRKEDFDEIFRKKTDGKENSRNKSAVDASSEMYRKTMNSYRRSPTDYYEYYPSCIRACLPSRRIGNMMTLYETNDALIITAGPHWPGVLVVVFMLLGGNNIECFQLCNCRFIETMTGAHMNYSHVGGSWVMQIVVTFFLSLSLLFLFLTACTGSSIYNQVSPRLLILAIFQTPVFFGLLI